MPNLNPRESSIIDILRERLTEQEALIYQLRQEKTGLHKALYGQLIFKPTEHDPGARASAHPGAKHHHRPAALPASCLGDASAGP